jgi:hypothetical protein
MARGHPVDHIGRDVGVAGGPAESGEVLDRDGDSCPTVAAYEGGAHPRDPSRGVAEPAVVMTDRFVGLTAGDHVKHGRKVQRHARTDQLAPPPVGGPTHVALRPRPLYLRSGHVGEAGSGQDLHLTAFLVQGDFGSHEARRATAHHNSQPVHQPSGRVDSAVRAAGEDEIPDAGPEGFGLGWTRSLGVGRDTHHHQLTGARAQAHAVALALRAVPCLRTGAVPGRRDRGRSSSARCDTGGTDVAPLRMLLHGALGRRRDQAGRSDQGHAGAPAARGR